MATPAPQLPKKATPTWLIVLLVLLGVFCGGPIVCANIINSGKRQMETERAAQRAAVTGQPVVAAEPGEAAAPPPKPIQIDDIQVATLLSEYKDNEVRADGEFKEHWIRVTGIANDIKKDITGSIYVTIGTGRQFEIPEIQCFFDDKDASKAAALNHGQKVTVVGRVDGLMMNVLVKDCAFVDVPATKPGKK